MKALRVGLVCFGCWVAISCSAKKDSIKPEYKGIVEAVYASGTIHPLNEYSVFANATGILRNIHAREGDSIHTNQSLFEVESRDPALRAQSAREAFEYARTNADEHSATLDELRANAQAAYLKYRNDSATTARNSMLFASGAVTQADLDKATMNSESSRALWVAAQQRLHSTTLSLHNQLSLAKRQMELAGTTQSNFEVQSRCDGLVYALYKEEGEMISSAQPVMLVGDAESFVLRLVIDASDVARVHVGQKVLYSLDAFPDSSFHATVMKIYPVLDNETQSFRVDARCDRKPAVPYVGTQVQANIIVSEKQRALVIPRSYLQPNNQVFVQNGSTVSATTVRVGAMSLESVEILSGIDEKSTIVRTK